MTDKDQKKPKADDPNLKDVEPGSDADATPLPEVGSQPPDPNKEHPLDKPGR